MRRTTVSSLSSETLQCHPAGPHMPASTRTLHHPLPPLPAASYKEELEGE